MKKFLIIFLIFCAPLLLQGCTTNKSNLMCADGCADAPAGKEQWSQQLGDKLFIHKRMRELYVHPETNMWELSATCGSPSLIRTLGYSLLGGAVSGLAYKTVSNPFAAGAIGGAANGGINQISQSGLNKVCRDAATVAAQHNARPEVSREITRWNVRKNLEMAKVQQEVTNELNGVAGSTATPGQSQLAPQQLSMTAEKHLELLMVCASDVKAKHPDLFEGMTPEQVSDDMDRRCNEKGQGGFGVLPSGSQCGCGGV